MTNYFKLAWRNLWRNKRRTMITVSSVLFGVVLSAVMRSMQEGTYDYMEELAVGFYSGYIQVHQKGYWENQKLNNAFTDRAELKDVLKSTPHITSVTPRIESFALGSSENITKGVMVLGVDPLNEDKATHLKTKLVEGKYLQEGDKGIMLSAGLANYLKLGVGDSLVMLGQGYHGVSATGIFPVKGIIKHPNPAFNRMLVYMDIAACQEFYSTPNMLTAYVIMLDDNNRVHSVQKDLQSKIDLDEYEVKNWKEMQPVLVQQIESDRQSGLMFKGILYMVIAFGLFGTILMMIAERKREFGVTVAVGMQKSKLKIILIIETILVGFVGVILGIIVSYPITYYFYLNPIVLTGQAAEAMLDYGFDPIMKFSLAPFVYYNQAITIFIFTLIISIYPVYAVNKLKVMEAIRGR